MREVWEEIGSDRESGARRLVAEFGNRLYAAALLLCQNRSDAEDLVFRAFERAIERIDRYRPTGEFYGWLYVIMLNLWRMDIRRPRPDVVSVGATTDLPEASDAALADSLAGVDAEAIRATVRRLSPTLAEVIVLRFFEGRSMDEMAAMLGVPGGTVRSRLFNAKAALGNLLKEARP